MSPRPTPPTVTTCPFCLGANSCAACHQEQCSAERHESCTHCGGSGALDLETPLTFEQAAAVARRLASLEELAENRRREIGWLRQDLAGHVPTRRGSQRFNEDRQLEDRARASDPLALTLVPVTACEDPACQTPACRRYRVERGGTELTPENSDLVEILADELARLTGLPMAQELRHRVYELTEKLLAQGQALRQVEAAEAERLQVVARG